MISRRPFVLGLGALLAALAVVACGGGGGDGDQESTPARDEDPTPIVIPSDDERPAVRGALVTPPFPKPDFVLTDTEGEPYDIVAETEGYLTLLYLGYTHCPDICPTHMLDIANALEEVPEEARDKVKVLFVTTDPERDTPEEIARWLALWDESFIGLTGDPETLVALQRFLGMNPAEQVDTGRATDGGYEVTHAAYVIAYTDDNLGHVVYPFGVTREDYVHDIAKLATEGWVES